MEVGVRVGVGYLYSRPYVGRAFVGECVDALHGLDAVGQRHGDLRFDQGMAERIEAVQ